MADWVRRLTTALLDRVLPGMPPATHRYEVRRGLTTPTADGVELVGDLYLPVEPAGPAGADRPPTILIRTPYGRSGLSMLVFARPFAERGFPVLVQSCRGTFGSGGVFTPMVHERADGLDTVRWVREQPWFTGRLVTAGASYLGFTQWAVAGYLQRDDPAAAPDALCLQVTMPDFGEFTWDNGAFGLRTALGWTRQVSDQERRGGLLRQVLDRRSLERGYDRLPANEADKVATGHTVHWYQDWLAHDSLADDYWTRQSHTATVPAVTAPVSMVTGWYDIFLPWQLRDYRTLVEAGNPPQLTVGPWGHGSPGLHRAVPAETIEFLNRHFLGGPSTREHPVRVYVTGAEEWRGLPVWPPQDVVERDWPLRAGGRLAPPDADPDDFPEPAGGPAPSRYTYDPADPTPAVGGPSLATGSLPGDNTELERRADVLTFTSPILREPVEVLGRPTATISLGSDRERTDVFVRICDVHPDGRSMTVCDGIRRLGGRGTRDTDPRPDADGVREVEVGLWPTAHRFRPGHRIRVQVSSGAHPRYLRNTGSDEPPATARALHRAHQEVHHDAVRRSRITLPTGGRA